MAGSGSTAAVHVPSRSELIDAQQARGLLRLEGELSELPPGSEQQRRHALSSLARMVGASVWVFTGIDWNGGGRPMLRDATADGFEGERERRSFHGYVDDAQDRWPDPSLAALPRLMTPPVSTFLREQLVCDRIWYRAPHVQELRRGGRVDSCIYGMIVDDGVDGEGPDWTAIALHRPWGDHRFVGRHRSLVDVFLRESKQFRIALRGLSSNGSLPSLPPRLKQTLSALARGLGEKQVADELGVSPHTVHDYVKALHRRLRVSSRAELLARFVRLPPSLSPPSAITRRK